MKVAIRGFTNLVEWRESAEMRRAKHHYMRLKIRHNNLAQNFATKIS